MMRWKPQDDNDEVEASRWQWWGGSLIMTMICGGLEMTLNFEFTCKPGTTAPLFYCHPEASEGSGCSSPYYRLSIFILCLFPDTIIPSNTSVPINYFIGLPIPWNQSYFQSNHIARNHWQIFGYPTPLPTSLSPKESISEGTTSTYWTSTMSLPMG